MARPDLPRTLAEFQGRLASEEDCLRRLVACRWPDGLRRPRCGSCRHQGSVTAGTVLHRTRVPLRPWFAAAYLVTTHTPGLPVRKGYDHRPSTVGGDPRNASRLLPRVRRTSSNLQTWLEGTHHEVGAKHLPRHVDELVFRLNSPTHPDGRVPVAARPDRAARADHLPDVVCC